MSAGPARRKPRAETGAFENRLERVLGLARSAAQESASGALEEPVASVLRGGRLLRARLALRLGGVRSERAAAAATAVELVHAGSLLHDDVIDGGRLRRNLPAFWTKRGVPAAVLLGDTLFATALEVLRQQAPPWLLHELIAAMREVCSGETEQELIRRDGKVTWETCLDIARRKTGPLFGFAAASAGGTPDRREALRASGIDLGTAYQLADDLLDAAGGSAAGGKSLGRDGARGKVTAAAAAWPKTAGPREWIARLRASARSRLAPWPRLAASWSRYEAFDFEPVLRCVLGTTLSHSGAGGKRANS